MPRPYQNTKRRSDDLRCTVIEPEAAVQLAQTVLPADMIARHARARSAGIAALPLLGDVRG